VNVSDSAEISSDVAPVPIEERVVPLLADRLSVERRRVETGRVIATVTTHHHEQVIKEDLVHEGVEVDRVPIGRTVDAIPPIREEGDTTIIPVVEEVLVVERRLILKEEVHLRRVPDKGDAFRSNRYAFAGCCRHAKRKTSAATCRAARLMITPAGHYTQRIKFMNEETIVAVFDTPEQADAAMRDLIACEVPESAISRHARNASGMTPADGTTAEAPHEDGFWSRLFGGDRDADHQVYDRSMSAGSTVISVRVAEAHVMQVSEILDRHNPIDIDERASGYGLASTKADGTAGEPPAGYAETQYDAPVARPAGMGIGNGSATAADANGTSGSDMTYTGAIGTGESDRLQLAEEQLVVGKRLINRGTTRVRRYVVETPVEEQVSLHEERVTLDRRPVTGTMAPDAGSFTDRTIEMAETREEAVVSKTAHVTEEVRLRKDAVDRVETVRDTLRREEVDVEQVPGETAVTPRP
jgi:uncharacterized protein (TIGR02271 family)